MVDRNAVRAAGHDRADLPPGLPPGPPGVPLLGNVLDAWRDPLRLFVDVAEAYGDVVLLRFGPYRYVLLSDVDGVHRVLVENAKNYTKSLNYQGLKLIMGDGLVTSDGDLWRRQRRLAQPAFHRERLAGFASAMAEETEAMLDAWGRRPAGAPMNLHAEMMKLTLRIVARTLFSTVVGAEADEIGRAMAIALRHANAYAESLVKMPQWLPTPANVRFKRAVRTLDALVFRIIDARRKNPGDARDLLAMLMAAVDDGTNTGMSDRQLRDEVMTLVMAGHETTANALTWTFHLLSTNPDVERRLAREVRDVLGDRAAPTLDDLPKLKTTSLVLQEAMRLFPPVWAFERQAIADDVVAGKAIPAGTIVAISPWVLHRHPRHWDNPEGFDPERFDRGEPRAKFAYLPFGAGPRTCIGNAFAMMEAQILTAMIARRHRLARVPGAPVEVDPVITLRPKGEMRVTLHPQAPPASERAADAIASRDGGSTARRAPRVA